MDMQIWLIIAIAITLLFLGVITIFATRGKKRPTDYYNFFIMGIIWTAVGIPLKNYILSVAGLIFLIISIVHKKDWEKNRLRWDDLDNKEKKWKVIIILSLGIILLAGFAILLLTKKGIL